MLEKPKKIDLQFNFTDITLLTKYLDDQKRILPRRITELSIKKQRNLFYCWGKRKRKPVS